MKKNIFYIVLIFLLIISVVQAVQLSGLKSTLENSPVKLSSGSAKQSVPVASGGHSGQGASLPSSLDDLPSMVGGC